MHGTLLKIINVFFDLCDLYTIKLNSINRQVQVGANERSVRKHQP